MNILHILTQFIAATLFALGALYCVYLYYRQQLPQAQKKQSGQGIIIENSEYLEAKKALHVVRVGHERFLVSSTEQGLQLLSPLASLSESEMTKISDEERDYVFTNPSSVSLGDWKGRFAASFRWVLADRFKLPHSKSPLGR